MSGNWTFSTSSITLTAEWSGTRAMISLIADENVVITGDATIYVEYGTNYCLPVPSITTGEPFLGWATEDGTLITDSEGNSIAPSTFRSNISLMAIYCTRISSTDALLSLSGLEKGNPLLSRSYILTNDLDFDGLPNQPIDYFEGMLNGNGHSINNLQNSLFASVGGSGEKNRRIEIKNLVFNNYNGSALIDDTYFCEKLVLSNITFKSFKKDMFDNNEFNGVIDNLGHGVSYSFDSIDYKLKSFKCNYSKNVSLNNIALLDEEASVNCGLINHINYVDSLEIAKCCIKTNTNNAAFINESRMPTYFDVSNPLSNNLYTSEINDLFKAMSCEWDIKIGYCSNYGNSTKLVDACIVDFCFAETTYESGAYKIKNREIKNNRLELSNIANYGNLSSSAFVNSAIYTDFIATVAGSYYLRSHMYTLPNANNYSVDHFINFGQINSIASSGHNGFDTPVSDKYKNKDGASFSFIPNSYNFTKPLKQMIDYSPYSIAIDYSFNAGLTSTDSNNGIISSNSNYAFTGYTNLFSETNFVEITNINQITSSFFKDVIGLDDNWDISYIKIDDNYGRPTILF